MQLSVSLVENVAHIRGWFQTQAKCIWFCYRLCSCMVRIIQFSSVIMRFGYLVLLNILRLSLVRSFETYRDQIPNGYNVYHPCKSNTKWDGVGHKTYTGAGARNPFGVDFSNQGSKWTEALCRRDSDGDGKSNGEELGEINQYSHVIFRWSYLAWVRVQLIQKYLMHKFKSSYRYN